MYKFLIYLLSLLTISISCSAEDINLVADDRVEWHQNEQKMIAIGNAVASKKDMSIRADKITGYYNGNNKKSSIKQVIANGNVIMKSPQASGFGDNLDYNVAKDSMILTGNPSTIKTASENITASDNITYYPSKQQAVATGKVIATNKEGNKIYADNMISYFKKNSNGNLEMDKVEVFGNLKITTKQAWVTAQKGIYYPTTSTIKLFNNVIIHQDENILKGDMAETNLNTGISKLLSDKNSTGRVSGVFKEKNAKSKQP